MATLVDDVKDKLDVVDIVSGYVKLTPAGANMRGLCPFHREKTPSFMVSKEKQIFHCFGCGKGGDVITFIEEMEGMEFKEALRMLAERAGLDYRRYQGTFSDQGQVDDKETIRRLLEATAVFYEKELKGAKGKKATNYLRERGLKNSYASLFRLGYAPRLNAKGTPAALYDHLRELGFSADAILKSGSVYKKDNQDVFVDRFRGRLIFPITDGLGRIVGFSARLLPGDESGQGKYINTPGTILYDKSSLLYGFHLAKNSIRESQEVIMLEGNLDVILSHQAGVKQAVATCGTAVGVKQLTYLRRFTEKLILAFDADMAGVKAAKRTAELAWAQDMDVKVIPLKTGKDVADIASAEPDNWQEMVKKPRSVAGYFFNLAFGNRVLSLDQKKVLAEKIIKLLSQIPSRVEQSYYLKKLAELVKVPENLLWEKISGKNANLALKQESEKEKSPFFSKGRRILLEERLIGLIFNYPELYFKNREKVGSIVLVGEVNKSIWREMKNYLDSLDAKKEGAKEKIDLKFSSRELNLLAKEYAISVDKELGGDSDNILEDAKNELLKCANALELEFLKDKRSELLAKIEKISPSKKKKLRAVMKQLERISKEINRKRVF